MTPQNRTFPPFHPQHPLRTVLIGTLLESESDPVVRAGLAVARAAGVRVLLVHAFPDGPKIVGPEIGMAGDFTAELRAWCEERLREQIGRLGIGESELAGVEVRAGVPHRILVEEAGKAAADLIVVGATGLEPFAAELLGSTADRVLRKASCPVLVVRGELPVPPRRVLAPVDLSPVSGDSFRCGLDLLAQIGGGADVEVRAVHALSFTEMLALQRRKDGEVSPEQAERWSGEDLRSFVLENRAEAPLEVDTAVLPGEARFEILQELAERPVDLIVMGTHGRGGVDRLMLGSVASAVVRKAPCSVLLISPDAALASGIAEAVTARMTPAWHREPVPVA
ncbi:MAG TPA: universal stress protein [Thermoanaerobaculia bacterium]